MDSLRNNSGHIHNIINYAYLCATVRERQQSMLRDRCSSRCFAMHESHGAFLSSSMVEQPAKEDGGSNPPFDNSKNSI